MLKYSCHLLKSIPDASLPEHLASHFFVPPALIIYMASLRGSVRRPASIVPSRSCPTCAWPVPTNFVFKGSAQTIQAKFPCSLAQLLTQHCSVPAGDVHTPVQGENWWHPTSSPLIPSQFLVLLDFISILCLIFFFFLKRNKTPPILWRQRWTAHWNRPVFLSCTPTTQNHTATKRYDSVKLLSARPSHLSSSDS